MSFHRVFVWHVSNLTERSSATDYNGDLVWTYMLVIVIRVMQQLVILVWGNFLTFIFRRRRIYLSNMHDIWT